MNAALVKKQMKILFQRIAKCFFLGNVLKTFYPYCKYSIQVSVPILECWYLKLGILKLLPIAKAIISIVMN